MGSTNYFPEEELFFETLQCNFVFEIHQSFKIMFFKISKKNNNTNNYEKLGEVKFELGEMLGRHENPCLFQIQGSSNPNSQLIIYHKEIPVDPFANGPWKDDRLAESCIVEGVRSSNPEELHELLSSNVITTF